MGVSYKNVDDAEQVIQAQGNLNYIKSISADDMVVGLIGIPDTESKVSSATGQTLDVVSSYSNQTGGSMNHNTGTGNVTVSSSYQSTTETVGTGLVLIFGGSPLYPPVVQTNSVTDITTNGGRLNGEITDVGLENADYIGFVFDTVSHGAPGDVAPASSDYAEYVTVPGDFGVESFSNNRSDLSSNTTYYIRACAHNSDGWAYGGEVSFKTNALPPFRFENILGVDYDETDTRTIFAERLNEILDRLHDLDGLDPS
jgi:hypothetical protein